MRFYYDAVVLTLLLPMAVGAGCVVVAALADRCRVPPVGHALVACAPALGFALAIYLLGWFRYPPKLNHEWLPYLGMAAALSYALVAAFSSMGWWAYLIPLEVGAATAWFLLPDWSFTVYIKERPWMLLAVPQFVFLAWIVWGKIGERSEGAGAFFPSFVWGGAVVTLLALSGNARFAQMALMVVAAQIGAALPGFFRVSRLRWRHTSPASTTLLVGLLTLGYLFSRDWEIATPYQIPRVCFLLVVLAPLAASVLELPGIHLLPPISKRLLQTLLVAAVAGFGLYLALTLPESLPAADSWKS